MRICRANWPTEVPRTPVVIQRAEQELSCSVARPAMILGERDRRIEYRRTRGGTGCGSYSTLRSTVLLLNEPPVPFPGRLAGVKMGVGRLPTPMFSWDQRPRT